MMHDNSETYADVIVTYHFVNISSDLIYDKNYYFSRRTTAFLFWICPDYC